MHNHTHLHHAFTHKNEHLHFCTHRNKNKHACTQTCTHTLTDTQPYTHTHTHSETQAQTQTRTKGMTKLINMWACCVCLWVLGGGLMNQKEMPPIVILALHGDPLSPTPPAITQTHTHTNTHTHTLKRSTHICKPNNGRQAELQVTFSPNTFGLLGVISQEKGNCTL